MAHPSITPRSLDQNAAPKAQDGWSADERALYALIVQLVRAEAYSQPSLIEYRRVVALGQDRIESDVISVSEITIAVGARVLVERGWTHELGTSDLPSPPLPSAPELDGTPPLGSAAIIENVRLVNLGQELSMPGLINLVERLQLGEPSTYAKHITEIIDHGLITVDDGVVRLTVEALRTVNDLRARSDAITPERAQLFRRAIDGIAEDTVRPSDALALMLGPLLAPHEAYALTWLDRLGNDDAGETEREYDQRLAQKELLAPGMDIGESGEVYSRIRTLAQTFEAALAGDDVAKWIAWKSDNRRLVRLGAFLDAWDASDSSQLRFLRYDRLTAIVFDLEKLAATDINAAYLKRARSAWRRGRNETDGCDDRVISVGVALRCALGIPAAGA